jgi:hypothetical protein
MWILQQRKWKSVSRPSVIRFIGCFAFHLMCSSARASSQLDLIQDFAAVLDVAYYAYGNAVRLEDYEELINRGWRR